MKKSVVYTSYDYKPRTPDVLQCLLNEPQWLDLLVNRNMPYEGILTSLQLLAYNIKSNVPCETSITSLSTTFGVKATKLAKWIHLIYSDLFDLNNENPMAFKSDGVQCEFIYRGIRHSFNFTMWLKVVPRRDELVYFKFLEVKTDFHSFHVHEIYHNQFTGNQHISITLHPSSPNEFRRFLSDKAIFYGLLESYVPSFMEVDELDKRLKELARRIP